jgi:hypothetical protein
LRRGIPQRLTGRRRRAAWGRVSKRHHATQGVDALVLTGAMSLDSKSIRRIFVFSFVSAGGSFRAIVMTLSIRQYLIQSPQVGYKSSLTSPAR